MFDPNASEADPRPDTSDASDPGETVEAVDPVEAVEPGRLDASPYAPDSPPTAPTPTWSEAAADDAYQSPSPPPIPPVAPSARPPSADPPSGRRRSPILAALVALSLATSGYAVARATGNKTTIVRAASANSTAATVSSTPTVPVRSSGTEEPVAAVAAALAPSVVQIETNQGLGSGFIYDSAGHILTAAHVVSGAGSTVTVRLADGTSRTGTVVGLDQNTDVAVVKVDLSGTKAKPASLATGVSLQVGQTAVAIGSPFGLDQTVTSGIVSAVDRAMQTTNGAIDMVQTDAPINPGNSGGPLADLQGRVIGINDQIESASGSSSGVGFAIPITTAKAVADKIVAGQPVTFAFLGVQTQDSGQGVVGNGALIVGVESGSPAAKAGVQQGDVVTKIGTTAIDSSTALSASIRQSSPGDVVKLTVERNGTAHTLTVTLGSTSAT
ncbi:MAG: putative serine protease PepD [Actinomycetota bacterium]|nr:putative serine protease PepD [Actinomycetota bacterium]